MIQQMGGNYRICDPKALMNGKEKIIWNGLWRKGTRDKILEFVDRYVELSAIIKESLGIIEVFLAPMETDQRTRRRIEGAIAHSLRNQPAPAGNLLPEDIRYMKRRKDESPICVRIECSEKVFGLPAQIKA